MTNSKDRINDQINDRLTSIIPGIPVDTLRSLPSLARAIADVQMYARNNMPEVAEAFRTLTAVADGVADGMRMAAQEESPEDDRITVSILDTEIAELATRALTSRRMVILPADSDVAPDVTVIPSMDRTGIIIDDGYRAVSLPKIDDGYSAWVLAGDVERLAVDPESYDDDLGMDDL